MADHLAHRMLDGEPVALAMVQVVGVLVCEGETDFLAAVTAWGDGPGLETAPAVIGIVSGAWTVDLAGRVPNGCTVTIATDPDPTGDGYAAKIAATLAARCKLRRWSPPQVAEVQP